MADTKDYAATFDIVDVNRDGRISAEELKSLMHALGQEISGETAKEVVGLMDTDGDGLISLEEFTTYMSRG